MIDRLGVRARAALVAALVVAAALLAGAWLLTAVLRSSLEHNFDTTLTQQAADRALLLDAGSAPADLVDVQQAEAFAWIGTADGAELAVGGSLRPVEPPLVVDPGTTATARLQVEERKPDESSVELEYHDLRVAGASTQTGELVVVAAELESVDRAVAVVRNAVLIGTPALMLLVAVLGWFSAGRALRPVERIRDRAARISGTSVGDRVPVPGGRDEIHDLALTMNEMLDRLDEHQRSIRRFTADAGHELRSPMANIRALVETTDPDTATWRTLQARLVTESDRAAALVDDLLFLAARDEGAAPPIEAGTVHLDDIVFDAAERLAEMDSIVVDIGAVTPMPVAGDRVLLDRVVRNLADNAARHARERVTFALSEEAGSAVLRVSDDGPGIPVDEREAVFGRFHRLDQGRGRKSGGTGLGLSIARRIVADHGGTIEVEEGDDGGACLTVHLPPARSS